MMSASEFDSCSVTMRACGKPCTIESTTNQAEITERSRVTTTERGSGSPDAHGTRGGRSSGASPKARSPSDRQHRAGDDQEGKPEN